MADQYIGRYNPKAVRLIIQDNYDVIGFASDIVVRRGDPVDRESMIGTQGDAVLVEHTDKSAMIEFSLLLNSPAILKLQELTKSRELFTIFLHSSQTQTELGSTEQGFIHTPAQQMHGTSPSVTERNWVLGATYWKNEVSE